jgi:hypothetical protein
VAAIVAALGGAALFVRFKNASALRPRCVTAYVSEMRK